MIARILEVQESEQPGPSQENDSDWNTLVTLEIIANPELTEPKRRVIELDYGMENGRVSISCRQALLFYTLRHLGLADEDISRPESQQITLRNRAEVD